MHNLPIAISNLVRTQIRSEIGKLTLEATFSAREALSATLLQSIDEATDPWGVRVTRVVGPAEAVAEEEKRAATETAAVAGKATADASVAFALAGDDPSRVSKQKGGARGKRPSSILFPPTIPRGFRSFHTPFSLLREKRTRGLPARRPTHVRWASS